MAKQLQLRRGTTAQHSTFTGAAGEVTVDTDKDVVVVHDGATAGGFPSQKELVSGNNIKTINNTSLLGSGNIDVIQTITNIDELKDFVASDNNYALNVLGYSEAGDGGGGTFYWDATSTETDNGGTIIEPTSGSGRWIRQYDGAVNVKWFGAKGDGVTDDSAAFQAAVGTRKVIHVPRGTYKASFTMNRPGQRLEGEDSIGVKIIPATNNYAIFANALYLTISNITLECDQTFTGTLLDCTGSASTRYLYLVDVTARQINTAGGFAYTAEALISINGVPSFTGYNTFLRSRTVGGKYGWKIANQFSSVTTFRDCGASNAGFFNIYCSNLSFCTFQNMDIANGGKLATSADEDRTATHGGIRIEDSSGVSLEDIYCEYNVNKYNSGWVPNNISIDGNSKQIHVRHVREERGVVGQITNQYLQEDMGSNVNLAYFNDSSLPSHGLNSVSGKNVILNPRFTCRNSNDVPYEWVLNTPSGAVFSYDTADKPLGFEGSLVMESPEPFFRIRQTLYSTDGSSPIKNLADYAGKPITATFWLKLFDAPNPDDISCTAGFSNQPTFGGNRIGIGKHNLNRWQKYTQQFIPGGTESIISFGIALQTGGTVKVKIAGMAVSLGSAVPNFEEDELPIRVTYNPPSLAAGASSPVEVVTATGLMLGDIVSGTSFSQNTQGLVFNAWVSGTNQLSYFVHNPAGNPAGTVDLPSGTVRFRVKRANHF